MNKEEFAELVKADVFGDASEEDHAWLRSDGVLLRWHSELERVTQGVKAQLENHHNGVRRRDESWYHRGVAIFKAYSEALPEANDLRADLNRRRSDLAGRLLTAIERHRTAAQDGGLEPEPWDEALWAVLTAEMAVR